MAMFITFLSVGVSFRSLFVVYYTYLLPRSLYSPCTPLSSSACYLCSSILFPAAYSSMPTHLSASHVTITVPALILSGSRGPCTMVRVLLTSY
ncbi:hypothetical protein GGF50DRAFT_96163 [Schizophyllum commune]